VNISYNIVLVHLKRQNRLKVGTDKPKLKVKKGSVSDDDVRKRLLVKLRFQDCWRIFHMKHSVKADFPEDCSPIANGLFGIRPSPLEARAPAPNHPSQRRT